MAILMLENGADIRYIQARCLARYLTRAAHSTIDALRLIVFIPIVVVCLCTPGIRAISVRSISSSAEMPDTSTCNR